MDCFINHISRFPDFSCQKGNTWVTRITLQSWSKSTISPNQYEEKTSRPGISKSTPTRSGFTRSTGYLPNIHPQETINEEDLQILLPPLLRESLQCINKDVFWSEQENPGIVSLEVSSIVLSTNGFGDFSQCTIISELLDGKGQKILSQQCKEIWERFIHQPQTARCLVFLAILGLLCQRMADQYREAMEYFIRFIDIDRYSIFDGNTLLEGRFSLTQLRLGLWSLESLFKLHNSLESSMRCIEEAAVELRAQIYYGPGRRSESLERMCEKSLEVFERKLGRLVVLNAELDQKIELNNRYKDSLSTILSLEDSKNSMQQNSTIQQLTYLTIGYLPVGLITAIFAIPSDQNVLIPSMGLGGYVASIFGLFILTFMAAMFMGQFLRSFMKLKTVRSFPSGGVGSNMTQLDLRRYLSWSSSSLSKSSSTSDIEQGKGVLS
ncbi:hypothetical protein F4818DRAFT_180300 [Hypoxylon cercidicola]|nr:hypothetical protein F4818DRAFT_180300 [Hypoxylon cercidicola]